MTIPMKYEDVVAKLDAERELHKLATETLGQFADENQKLHAGLAALREELERRTADLLECGTRRKDLQQRLTVAEQRDNALKGLLIDTKTMLSNELSFELFEKIAPHIKRIDAALKPARQVPECVGDLERFEADDGVFVRLGDVIDMLGNEKAVQHQGDPVVGHCTHPPGCKFCSWCGFKAEKPAPIPAMRVALEQSQTDLQEGRTVSVEQLRDNLAAKFIGKKP